MMQTRGKSRHEFIFTPAPWKNSCFDHVIRVSLAWARGSRESRSKSIRSSPHTRCVLRFVKKMAESQIGSKRSRFGPFERGWIGWRIFYIDFVACHFVIRDRVVWWFECVGNEGWILIDRRYSVSVQLFLANFDAIGSAVISRLNKNAQPHLINFGIELYFSGIYTRI